VLSWQLSSEWAYDADLWTELEITFSPEGPGRTRVELEHRGLDAYGEDMDKMRDSLDSCGGWPGLLDEFAAAAVA
jgi:uncharacterized protein YndB with AHSA1/START domain